MTLDGPFVLQIESARTAIRAVGLDPLRFEISRTPMTDEAGLFRIKVRKQGAVMRQYSARGGSDWLLSFVEDLRQGRFD